MEVSARKLEETVGTCSKLARCWCLIGAYNKCSLLILGLVGLCGHGSCTLHLMLVGGIVERLEPVGGAHCARSMWLRFCQAQVFVSATNSCNIRCFQVMKFVAFVVEKNYFYLAPFN
jgi:hypothetical protein